MNIPAQIRTMLLMLVIAALACPALASDKVKIDSGTVQGIANADSSLRIFRGIPFAAPPVGDLRWRPPQPVKHWKGVRKALDYGPRCYQAKVYGDMIFRSAEMSEDCLYLTVWTPAQFKHKKLPVYLWFYGGGFVAGSSDEGRYDGESFAKHGIVVVNANYRLGIFGYFADPDLTAESPHHASGDYGMLDQVAALEWVRKNIARFGGDPQKITIGGESAGSLSVSALMASPLSRNLFQQAIGESGAFFGKVGGRGMPSLAEAEKYGADFAASLGKRDLAALRGMSAADLLAAASKKDHGFGFWPIVDGYFLPADVQTIFAEGKQSHVPLLAGWNADEVRMGVMMAKVKPNTKTFPEQLRRQFGDRADEALKVYGASTDEQALRSAGDLASDLFIVYGTWKWIDTQAKAGVPVYRYQFDKAVPIPEAEKSSGFKTFGAPHASELEYVFTMLDSKKADWQPNDYQVAKTMNDYWANFIRTGDPNGSGLAEWPQFEKAHEVMHINVKCQAMPAQHRDRYEFLDSFESSTTKH
jgi:para-nitrobenzyl esterase